VIDIAGTGYYEEDVRFARAVLADSPGVMVRQPLARAGSPLAGMDYHAIYQAEVAAFPELRLENRTHSDPAPHVKWAVLHCLDRVLREAAGS
jgi:hypothetical protein